MPWQTLAPFTSARIMAAAVHPDGTWIFVTSAGEIARAGPDRPATILRKPERQLNGVALRGDGSFACVGRDGLFLKDETSPAECIDPQVELTSIALGAAGEICIAGKYDERTGAIYRRDASTQAWKNEPPVAGRTGIEAVIPVQPHGFLLAGQRGWLETIAGLGSARIQTSTQHPLRALCAATSTRWFVGGGDWAQEMPILLEITAGTARPLAAAGGSRVIVGIASNARGAIWIAHNTAGPSGWTGGLARLGPDSAFELSTEFQAQLHGVAASDSHLLVYGAAGFAAWLAQP